MGIPGFIALPVFLIVLAQCTMFASAYSCHESDSRIACENAHSARVLARFGQPQQGFDSALFRVAFAPDGNTLATVGCDCKLRLWEVSGVKERTCINIDAEKFKTGICRSLWFSHDGTTVIATINDHTICFWNTQAGKEMKRTILQAQMDIYSFALSRDEKTLAVIDRNRDKGRSTITVYDLPTRCAVRTLEEPADEKGHPTDSGTIAISPEGTLLAAPYHGNKVCLWDLSQGKEKHLLKGHQTGIRCVAFSPDGKTLASSSGRFPLKTEFAEDTIKLWDVATGKEIRALDGHRYVDRCVAFSPDGKMFASAGDFEESIFLWEVATGKILRRFRDEGNQSRWITFSPDSSSMASAMSDGTAIIWDLAPQNWEKPKEKLSAKQSAQLWADLRNMDVTIAQRAVWTLAASKQAIGLLTERLQPIGPVKSDLIREFIADLDHNDFARREAASTQLARLINQAEPLLRDALETTKSPEQSKRLKTLLKGRETWAIQDPDLLQAVRAIWVLQRIGTPEAKALLEKLAAGAPTARQTQEAQAALDFLKKTKQP
jgi:WD40 repeat protein